MKIENIKISIPKRKLSEQSEIEEWRNETPMDEILKDADVVLE